MKKNNKPFGVIYTVECKITGEFYVGATTKSVKDRKQDHEERANRGETNELSKAIATFGTEAFNWVQTDTANTINELAQKEKQTIAKFNSKNSGLNSDAGGGFKKTIYQYEKESGSLLKEFDCLKSAANAVSVSKNSISNACLGKTKSCKGYYWSYEKHLNYKPEQDNRLKEVYQYGLDGSQLNAFKSVSEASKQTGVNKGSIAKVCRGERKSAGGFVWSF